MITERRHYYQPYRNREHYGNYAISRSEKGYLVVYADTKFPRGWAYTRRGALRLARRYAKRMP